MLATFRKCVGANPIMVTLLLTVSTCFGQSRRGDVITNVPFPFMVADHELPPGRYIVTPIGETNLRIYANKKSVIFQTHCVAGKAPDLTARMVFHRYGNTYFLSEVWRAGNGTGSQLFTSQAERNLAQRTEQEIAVLHPAPVGEPCDHCRRDVPAAR